MVRVRLDSKATSISLLVVLGIRRDGQKVLLAVRNMGGESEAAWRSLLDDLVWRGLPAPGYVIIDGAAGLEKALSLVWPEALVQRCTVHKHRNLLAHAPERLHEEISAEYNDMTHRRSPCAAPPRRNAAAQDRDAARRDQAHASIGPVILPSTNCRLYYRLVSNQRQSGTPMVLPTICAQHRVSATSERALRKPIAVAHQTKEVDLVRVIRPQATAKEGELTCGFGIG